MKMRLEVKVLLRPLHQPASQFQNKFCYVDLVSARARTACDEMRNVNYGHLYVYLSDMPLSSNVSIYYRSLCVCHLPTLGRLWLLSSFLLLLFLLFFCVWLASDTKFNKHHIWVYFSFALFSFLFVLYRFYHSVPTCNSLFIRTLILR